MRLWLRRPPPVPPQGVRIISPDGDVIDCDVFLDPGHTTRQRAVWAAVPRREFLACSPGWAVAVDVLPPRSAIHLSLTVGGGAAGPEDEW